MEVNLRKAIETWRKASYEDNSEFRKQLEPLYRSLVKATQVVPCQADIENFLTGDGKGMDRCVRWHLLELAIDDSRNGTGTGTNNANVQLAKTIMASEKAGWNLMFFSPTGKKMKALCNWEREAGKQEQPEQQTKQQGKTVTEAFSHMPSGTNRNPHLRIKKKDATEKTLFAVALCEGHPYMGTLLAEVQELCCREQQEADKLLRQKRTKEDIANLVRNNNKDLHDDIIKAHKTAKSAFGDVLREIPGVLHDPAKFSAKDKSSEKDKRLLDRVIEEPFLDLAVAILASRDHCKHLTTREYIVKAIKNWMAEKNQQSRVALLSGHNHNQDDNKKDDNDDDSDDDDDDNDEHNSNSRNDEKCRRDLAIRVLSHAPNDVLRSPEVLTVVIKNNLLDDADILVAYAKGAGDDSRTSPVPFASFKPVASFLKDVRGILHMAVLYQQRPLVETLLRYGDAELTVKRANVESTTAGGTILGGKGEGKETDVDSTSSAANVTKGANDTNGVPSDQKVQKSDSGYYPLWYNNEARKAIYTELPDTQDKDIIVTQEQQNLVLKKVRIWEQIRSALIYCTMKNAENVQTLLTILRESKEPENEINFDMSRLLLEGTSVADFVTSMPRHGRSYSLIRYEETIRYAGFPVLDLSTQPQTPVAQNQQRSHLQRTHTEILDMLEWLAGHGVRRIITLRVPDRMAHPHDELEIAKVVRRFRVEELDWRILDLSLNIFQPYGGPEDIPLVCTVDNDKSNEVKAKNIKADKTGKTGNKKMSPEKSVQETYLRTLHLYTGGRRSALDHWFSKDGLESMKLTHVYIHVIKELTTKEQCDATLRYINAKVDELENRKVPVECDVQSQFWTAQTETPRLQEIIHHLSPRLAQFVAYYRQVVSERHGKKKSFQPTKVAIIDNGILSMDPPSAPREAGSALPEDAPGVHDSIGKNNSGSERHLHSQEFLTADNLWARICDGKSFVYEQDRVSPWYLASNPHGTQMANLVCAIDPLCQLFVAKIADSHYGYSAARAAEAVDWAISKDVDIISMSFTTTDDHELFNEAVQKAMRLGILVVCSHHDEGARIGTKVFPACLGGGSVNNMMLRMASCNMYGKLQHDWDDNTTDKTIERNNQYDFCINSQDVAVGAIPFLATSTERISGSSVATAIAAGVCSLLIACLRTLDKESTEAKADGNTERGHDIRHIRKNVTDALATKNRPTYADINTFLATMAPSESNSRFITLDRFAHLNELRDVNTSSLRNTFLSLGANFPGK